MKVLKRMTGLSRQFGGEEHVGWLPPGAARPLPTPITQHVLDFEITGDGGDGFLLCYESRDGQVCGDNWFQTVAEAERAASEWFGINPSQWADESTTAGN
jgi:hypothetical protein